MSTSPTSVKLLMMTANSNSFSHYQTCKFGYPNFKLVDEGSQLVKDVKQCSCVSRTSKGNSKKILW